MKVEFTRPALTELDAIFAYIHQRNPVASIQVVARVREITAQLGRFPEMGHPKYKPAFGGAQSAVLDLEFLPRCWPPCEIRTVSPFLAFRDAATMSAI